MRDKLLNELSVPPNTSYLDISADHDTLAILNIVKEFTDVHSAIWVDLLAMLVAHSIVEHSDDLSILGDIVVASKTCHLRVMELTRVLISVTEVGDSLALKEAEPKFPLKHSIGVVEDSESMHFASLELSLIEELSVRSPTEFSFSMILSVFELAIIGVTITPNNLALPMEDVGYELPFINRLCWRELRVDFGIMPNKLPIAFHAGVHELTNIVSAIGPLELSLSFDSRIFHSSAINIDLCDTMNTCGEVLRKHCR